MNDVAIVKEGWLHKRGQCPRASPAEGPELGPWLFRGRGWTGLWLPGLRGLPGLWEQPRGGSRAQGPHGLRNTRPSGPPGWEHTPQAGVQPPGRGCGWGEPPAFLEGSEDWGPSKAWHAGGPGHCLRAPEGRAGLAGLAQGQSWPGCGQEGAPHCLGPGVGRACTGAARLPGLPPAQPAPCLPMCPCAQGGALGKLVGWSLVPGASPCSPVCLTAFCPREADRRSGGWTGLVSRCLGRSCPPAPGRGLAGHHPLRQLPLPADRLPPRALATPNPQLLMHAPRGRCPLPTSGPHRPLGGGPRHGWALGSRPTEQAGKRRGDEMPGAAGARGRGSRMWSA